VIGLLQDLALMVAALAVAAGSLTAVVAAARARWVTARGAALLVVAIAGLYAAALVGAARASRERTLPLGAEKSVGGFDPHLHYAVAAPSRRSPDGTLLVTVRLRSDARAALQRPASLRATLADARGRRWAPLDVRANGTPAAFARPLGPGEATEAHLAFRVPAAARGLRLLVEEAGFPCPLQIGAESSPGHRKSWFALGASSGS
jgi:hypothetical protein